MTDSNLHSRKVRTKELSEERLIEAMEAQGVTHYEVVPRNVAKREISHKTSWKICLESLANPDNVIALNIVDNITLGREGSELDYVNVTPSDSPYTGVSRQHAMLSPAPGNLFIMDLDSTNGTRIDGHAINPYAPHILHDGSVISLGTIQFKVRIVEQPQKGTMPLARSASLIEALVYAATTITSQLELDTVYKEAARVAQELCNANNSAIWLLEEGTNRLRLANYSGEISATQIEQLHQMSTKEAATVYTNERAIISSTRILMPLTVSGTSPGVLGVFSQRNFVNLDRVVQLLDGIVSITEVSVQNAHVVLAKNFAIERPSRELDALNEFIGEVSATLDLNDVYEKLRLQLLKHWGIEHVMLWMFDTQSSSLLPVVHTEFGTASWYSSHDLTQFAKWVFSTQMASLIDLSNFKLEGDKSPKTSTQQINTRTRFAGMPLFIKDEAVGVILHKVRANSFQNEDELQKLQDFISPIANAIENATLYEEQMRVEKRLKKSLGEKRVLLQEIHHRVKNNLQVISSMLNLQSHQVQNPEAIEALLESQNRITAIALVHEHLYNTGDLEHIEIGKYIDILVNQLEASYQHHTTEIDFNINVPDLSLAIDIAIPCGLIINELVSNAIKHAFPDTRTGIVFIEMLEAKPGHYSLSVRDNGIGFLPRSDRTQEPSLGLNIIHSLTTQLDGQITFNSANGTYVTIEFEIE